MQFEIYLLEIVNEVYFRFQYNYTELLASAKERLAKKIEAFKGTRKQLAAKYGVSERTAYRWINKARAQGANIPSKANKSRYPGEQILYEVGTNKELAQSYGVSPRTVSRWKKKARDKQEIDQINILAASITGMQR